MSDMLLKVTDFNAEVVNHTDLNKWLDLGKGIVLHRDRSIPADGIFVRRGHAFVMSGKGCPVIIAASDEYLLVAHAGRDSLIDRGAVVGENTRENVSVVESIVEAFQERGVPANEISMRMEFAIPAAVFEHRFDGVDGDHNRRLCELIRDPKKGWPSAISKNGGNSFFLDLEALFEEQTRQAGVTDALAENSLAEFPFLAHTRNGQNPCPSNLFIFKHDA